MEMRELGRTGLKVSRLGVGLAEMGHLPLAEGVVAELHRRFEQAANP